MLHEEDRLTAEVNFMIKIKQRGSFDHLETLLKKIKDVVDHDLRSKLDGYGRAGVNALAAATPVDSGETANSWDYTITEGKNSITITWTNSNVEDGIDVPIAVILHYGHATGNGGYVQGIDYINPALKPLFDEIAIKAWEEVTKA